MIRINNEESLDYSGDYKLLGGNLKRLAELLGLSGRITMITTDPMPKS